MAAEDGGPSPLYVLAIFSALLWLIPATLFALTYVIDVGAHAQELGYTAIFAVNVVIVMYVRRAMTEPAGSQYGAGEKVE